MPALRLLVAAVCVTGVVSFAGCSDDDDSSVDLDLFCRALDVDYAEVVARASSATASSDDIDAARVAAVFVFTDLWAEQGPADLRDSAAELADGMLRAYRQELDESEVAELVDQFNELKSQAASSCEER